MISIDLANGEYIAVSKLPLQGDYDTKKVVLSENPIPS